MKVSFSCRPNLTECHRSFLLLCLLRASLAEALVEVVVTSSERPLSIRAALFLAEFTHMIYTFLPSEVNPIFGCLPTLISYVSSSDNERYVRRTIHVRKRGLNAKE